MTDYTDHEFNSHETGSNPFPNLNIADLEQDIVRLKAERERVVADNPAAEYQQRVLEVLLRNRENLCEMLRHGRFR